jgi:MFS family permease
VVGYVADRCTKKNITALFYAVFSASLLLLGIAREPAIVWVFGAVFGFPMGADYVLTPLVTAECFGTSSLGKLLALIFMGYSLGQWGGPWIAGSIFDARHTYDVACTSSPRRACWGPRRSMPSMRRRASRRSDGHKAFGFLGSDV